MLEQLGAIRWVSEWRTDSEGVGATEMMLIFLFSCVTFIVVTIFLELPETGFNSLVTLKDIGARVVLADLAVTGKGPEVFSAMLKSCHSLGIETAAEGRRDASAA